MQINRNKFELVLYPDAFELIYTMCRSKHAHLDYRKFYYSEFDEIREILREVNYVHKFIVRGSPNYRTSYKQIFQHYTFKNLNINILQIDSTYNLMRFVKKVGNINQIIINNMIINHQIPHLPYKIPMKTYAEYIQCFVNTDRKIDINPTTEKIRLTIALKNVNFDQFKHIFEHPLKSLHLQFTKYSGFDSDKIINALMYSPASEIYLEMDDTDKTWFTLEQIRVLLTKPGLVSLKINNNYINIYDDSIFNESYSLIKFGLLNDDDEEEDSTLPTKIYQRNIESLYNRRFKSVKLAAQTN